MTPVAALPLTHVASISCGGEALERRQTAAARRAPLLNKLALASSGFGCVSALKVDSDLGVSGGTRRSFLALQRGRRARAGGARSYLGPR